MADEYFERLWDEVVKELQEIHKIEKRFLGSRVIRDRKKAHSTLENNYIRYIGIINKLNECCSHIVQPQELKLARSMLENCIGRYLEIKQELVELNKTDFIYLDDLLVEIKKTVVDVNITVPNYYRLNRVKRLENIDSIIVRALEEKAKEEEEAEKHLSENEEEKVEVEQENTVDEERLEGLNEQITDDDKANKKKKERILPNVRPKFEVVVLTEEEKAILAAVFLLQRHERARVARLRAQIAREKIRLMEDIAWLRHKPIPEDVKLEATCVIQKYWKRFRERRHQTYLSTSRNLLLGLLEPNWKPGKETKFTLEELQENRRKIQQEALEAIEDALAVARIRMEKNTDTIRESIVDELRYFIYTWYKATEAFGYPKLPVLPDAKPILPGPFVHGIPADAPEGLAEKFILPIDNRLSGRILKPIGGSAIITAGHLVPVDVYNHIIDIMEKSKDRPKPEKKKLTKRELKVLRKKQLELEERRMEALRKEGFVPTASKFNDFLGTDIQDYLVRWKNRDVSRKLNQDLIDEDVAMELHLSLRKEVDEEMKLELLRLQNAINAQKNKPPKVLKPPPEVKEKRKKKGFAIKSEEEWVIELAKIGFIRSYSRHYFDDIPGIQSTAHYERRQVLFEDPPPQWGDYKQIVKEYCVLPLGSKYINEKTRTIRSVLVCGPQFLISQYVDSICTESGAVCFLLDPMAQPTQSCSKKKFNYIFTKTVRSFKPVVIHIPGVEKVFYKKIPKEEKDFNPKALGKVLPKLVKGIKPGDQVLVLGTSDQPWAAIPAQMIKIFDKVICFPDTDYHTLQNFWTERLFKYPGVSRYINIAVLTNMTRGYDFEELDELIEKVMTTDRIINMKNKPLEEHEVCMDLRLIDRTVPQLNSWDWSQDNVKMYLQRRLKLTVEAEKRAKEMQSLAIQNKDKKKKKNLEINDKFTISNTLMSRDLSRPPSGCAPYAPERQIDAVREYYKVKKETPVKSDLHRNERSLETFPIQKPLI